MIRADFLTPRYDITFSAKAKRYKRRLKKDRFRDLRMLPEDAAEPIVFLVTKAYVGLACELTKGAKSKRHLFYNSKYTPRAPGCILKRCVTNQRTNWHYKCANGFNPAKDFMAGRIGIDP